MYRIKDRFQASVSIRFIVIWIIKWICFRSLWLWRKIIGPIMMVVRPVRTFVYKGESLSFYYHRYNCTWDSERGIEIPIALKIISGGDPLKIMEIGCVLPHYYNTNWLVVDKYEKKEGVHNVDIEHIVAQEKYNKIISISTFEHVGLDEEDKNPAKAVNSLEHVLSSLLADHGEFLMTFPLGHNEGLDKHIYMFYKKNTVVYKRMFGPKWSILNGEWPCLKYGKLLNFWRVRYLAVVHIIR